MSGQTPPARTRERKQRARPEAEGKGCLREQSSRQVVM